MKIHWLIGVLAYFFIAPIAWASGEFQADYDVTYAVSPTGTTIVTQNITLTNKLTNLYPKRYAILIDSDKIKNIIASDGAGIITPQINLKDGKTEIILAFNEQVVGLGKTLAFTLRYEHADIAHKNGRIWEVTIPGVSEDPDLGSYRVTLSVPPSFGKNAYLTPVPLDGRSWTKEQMVKGGISAAYGSEQVFGLELSYYLANDSVTKKTAEIALPPDTAYQNVTIVSLTPKPTKVNRDLDGNWLAQYELSPGQNLHVAASLEVTTFLEPKKHGSGEQINASDYLKPLPYWEVYDARIVALASTYRSARDIYTYVVQNLSYDYQRVTQSPMRLGAVGILTNPKQAICMEFTDLFIAIARAAGIPAREVVGYAHTTNSKLRPLSLISDVLHAWPEYYDSERELWVPIDPTWANTTGGMNYFDHLDFNHITFAIHGLSSQYPYPAGFYKKENKNTKDVAVRFIETVPRDELPQLFIETQFPGTVTAGINASGVVTIANNGTQNVSEVVISVDSSPGDIRISKTEHNIPPFGIIQIPISLQTPNVATVKQGRIVVTANEETSVQVFRVRPMYWLALPLVLVLVGIVILVWKLTKR